MERLSHDMGNPSRTTVYLPFGMFADALAPEHGDYDSHVAPRRLRQGNLLRQ